MNSIQLASTEKRTALECMVLICMIGRLFRGSSMLVCRGLIGMFRIWEGEVEFFWIFLWAVGL